MFIAKKDFKAYKQGFIKKGDKVEFNATWLLAGLIEEVLETKPLKVELETKPLKKKAETKKGKR